MKKNYLFLILFAAFAMIFTGCKKDSSSSSNNGGNPTPPQPGTYGTVTVGNQSFSIVMGGYYVEYEEDIEAFEVGIALVDRADVSEDFQSAIIVIPYYQTLPTGQFNFTLADIPEQGDCGVAIDINDVLYVGTQGSASITKNGDNYTINASGKAMNYNDVTATETISISFTGPLVDDSK